MDKHNRLTKEREWIIGADYRLKTSNRWHGAQVDMSCLYTCTDVRLSVSQPGGHSKPGWVELKCDAMKHPARFTTQEWHGKFTRV